VGLPSDPFTEIRLLSAHTVHGPNYWARSSVTRVELEIGAYDEISSADVAGVTAALVDAFPGLAEHRCSYGEPGGFIRRLREGTYAAHIVEHLALELQSSVGHQVGFGRARGAERPGEYTVVLSHGHAAVGLRAAGLAVQLVQCAFAGLPVDAAAARAELEIIAPASAEPPVRPAVRCIVTGGPDRMAARGLVESLHPAAAPVVDVSPAYILQAGLPYAGCTVAVVVDGRVDGVPARFREPARAAQLLSVVGDALETGGVVVLPAEARSLQERIVEGGKDVALFSLAPAGSPGWAAGPGIAATAVLRGGEIVVEANGGRLTRAPLTGRADPRTEAAAVLAAHLLAERIGRSAIGTGRSAGE
jgi:hypothetical protein